MRQVDKDAKLGCGGDPIGEDFDVELLEVAVVGNPRDRSGWESRYNSRNDVVIAWDQHCRLVDSDNNGGAGVRGTTGGFYQQHDGPSVTDWKALSDLDLAFVT